MVPSLPGNPADHFRHSGLRCSPPNIVPRPVTSMKVRDDSIKGCRHKSAVTTNLLILPVQKSTLDAAPQFSKDKIARSGEFAIHSQAVDSYWNAHPPVAMK
jgi:hypothetical protein